MYFQIGSSNKIEAAQGEPYRTRASSTQLDVLRNASGTHIAQARNGRKEGCGGMQPTYVEYAYPFGEEVVVV